MTIRKVNRGGEPRLIVDIPYRTADERKLRYRRDAQIQTKCGAEAEHRRLIAELARTGTLERVNAPAQTEVEATHYTFADAVRRFRATHMQTALKPSTRDRYGRLLDKLMVPRFGETMLAELNGDALGLLDAELVQDELAASTRRNVHIVFRSVLRCAVQGGYLDALPRMPKLPPVGRKHPREVRLDDVEAVLAEASDSAKLAFSLATMVASDRKAAIALFDG